jgi:Txe/YoeB family toxin of Txe-Axe toxin-antitoxin module
MREDPNPHIQETTNAVVRQIIDLINEIKRDGVTQTRIDEFSDLKRLFASRNNRRGNYNNENAQIIDLAVEALNSQDLAKTDSVEWCRALLDIIFDNTKSPMYNGETQATIKRDFNEVHNKIKRFRQEVEEGTREGNPNTNLSRNILPNIERALRDKNRQVLAEIVDKLKVQQNTQLVQRAVDITDRQLKGLSWIKEFLKNLYNEGAIGNTKFDKLEQLILQN